MNRTWQGDGWVHIYRGRGTWHSEDKGGDGKTGGRGWKVGCLPFIFVQEPLLLVMTRSREMAMWAGRGLAPRAVGVWRGTL